MWGLVDLSEGLVFSEVDCGKWRSFFGVRRVCSGRISAPNAGSAGLDFFFSIALLLYSYINISETQSWGRELFLRSFQILDRFFCSIVVQATKISSQTPFSIEVWKCSDKRQKLNFGLEATEQAVQTISHVQFKTHSGWSGFRLVKVFKCQPSHVSLIRLDFKLCPAVELLWKKGKEKLFSFHVRVVF